MTIADNCVVSIEYELTEAGGSDVIDSNIGQAPLDYISGKGQIIPGLESQLTGLSAGEKADVKVNAAEAYGEMNPEAVDTLPKEQFAGLDLQVGMQLYGQGENGETVTVTVKEFNDETVTIDYNHPLAGKDLMFSVSVVNVREATPDEVLSGQIGGPKDSGESCGTGCGCH
ncbi:MAG: peptidylprolyl isomerase [Epsilonproteobacteria bacterium]|nr:peptidylprolyl isomerase [Campylobacterota bacterium]